MGGKAKAGKGLKKVANEKRVAMASGGTQLGMISENTGQAYFVLSIETPVKFIQPCNECGSWSVVEGIVEEAREDCNEKKSGVGSRWVWKMHSSNCR